VRVRQRPRDSITRSYTARPAQSTVTGITGSRDEYTAGANP